MLRLYDCWASGNCYKIRLLLTQLCTTFGRVAADIALYAYTHVAQEGGFDLASYGSVSMWLDRVASLSDHILITD